MTKCGCGYDDCEYLAFGYPYCDGCGDHHRKPVGWPCPVWEQDFWAYNEYYRADGAMECYWCGREYRQHVIDADFPWLRLICNGVLVKL